MAIYTESAVQYNGVQRESIEDVINDDRVVPSESDDFISEGMEVILGMTENYNMVMEHVGRSELLALEQTGEQLVYTEGVIGSIFSTIKKFLTKVWEKIKSLFKRFIMMIDSYTKNDRAFINKYRQQIYRHKSLSDFTFKGYIYTIDTGKITKMMSKLKDISNEVLGEIKDPDASDYSKADEIQKDKIDKIDDIMEEKRGTVLHEGGGKTGKYTEEEFRKELKELFRNGETDKQDLDGNNSKEIDVDVMVTELQNYRETKKIIDTAFKENKKAIDEDNKTAERLQKEYGNDDSWKTAADSNVTTGSGRDKVIFGMKNSSKNTRIYSGIEEFIEDIDNGVLGNIQANDSLLANIPNLIKEGKRTRIEIGTFPSGSKAYCYLEKQSGTKIVATFTGKEVHQRQGKLIHYAFKVINQSKACLVDVDTAVLQALKERSRQYKACLVKIVYHNPKNEEAYNESYSYHNQFQQNFTSPLSNIEFK